MSEWANERWDMSCITTTLPLSLFIIVVLFYSCCLLITLLYKVDFRMFLHIKG
jgi:hypothetical protein